jgi:hypothetical protein
MAANQTDMKNTAIDILGYEERNNDNKEWFDEDCRQLLVQKNKAFQANKCKKSIICKEKETDAHSM